MSVLWAVSLGLLALGPGGLSCLGGTTAVQPVEHHETPAKKPPTERLAVTRHKAIPPGSAARKFLPPPPATQSVMAQLEEEEQEFAKLFTQDTDNADDDETLPAPPPPAVKDSHLSPRSQVFVAKLLDVWQFALGGVGIVGQTSKGKRLTLRLAHQPDAVAAFDWLANQSMPVPQLYAYWALRTLAPEHARAHVTELSHDLRRVVTTYGCTSVWSNVGSLVSDVENRPMPRR